MRATFQAAQGLLSTDGIYPCLARRLFTKATRCGHSVCNACFSVLSPVYKLTNFRLSSENNSPDCFLSSSPLQFNNLLYGGFFLCVRRFKRRRACFQRTGFIPVWLVGFLQKQLAAGTQFVTLVSPCCRRFTS